MRDAHWQIDDHCILSFDKHDVTAVLPNRCFGLPDVVAKRISILRLLRSFLRLVDAEAAIAEQHRSDVLRSTFFFMNKCHNGLQFPEGFPDLPFPCRPNYSLLVRGPHVQVANIPVFSQLMNHVVV